MEPNSQELLSALKDAEEFISVTLSKESLTLQTENKRKQLGTKLKNLANRTSSGNENSSLPPRLPKPTPNLHEEDNDGEDFYDDVGPDAIEVKEEEPGRDVNRSLSPSYFSMGVDGVSKETKDNVTQESYEDMSTKDNVPQEEDTYDDTLNLGDSTPLTEEANYEIAEPGKASTDATEEDLYETQEDLEETNNKADSVSLEQQKRSTANELGMLTNSIKAAEVEEVLCKGYIEKHRKKGKIYIGVKWQKRYCVVRSFVLYYFVNQNSDRQKGTIILPGYKVSIHKPCKTGRQFILTRDKDRSYIFQGESKEEVEKWMNAIQKAANAKISNRQSEILEEIRSKVPDGDEDASSLFEDVLERSKNGSMDGGQNAGEELYDDLNENNDSGSGSGSGPASISNYEIPEAEPSSKPKIELTATEEPPGQDDIYEMPENESQESSAPAQPPRPATLAPAAVPSIPNNLPAIPPTTEEEEELYDDVGVEASPEPVKSRNIPEDSGKASPAMPRPALPSPPREPKQAAGKPNIPPRRNGSTPDPTSSTGKAPAPLPPEEETIPDKAPPTEEEQVIDFESIYQALWDCKPDADDELEFNRGDLIYVYEKPHSDWWIGSKYSPQGLETRLIPKNYLTEAYNLVF